MADDALSLPLFDAGAEAADPADVTRRLPPVEAASPGRAGIGIAAPPAPARSGALVRHAWPLISVLARITAGSRALRPDRFKEAVADLVRGFDREAASTGLDPRQIAAASYALCTAIDEAVSTSAWSDDSGWDRNSLLSMFHGETWGGEKFFTLVERALARSRTYGELLELFHFILVLGFQGKFRRQRDGTAAADALRQRIFDALQPRFGSRGALPVPAPQPVRGRVRFIRYLPVWSVAMVCLFVGLLIFATLDYRLQSQAFDIAQLLDSVGAPAAAASGAAAGPSAANASP